MSSEYVVTQAEVVELLAKHERTCEAFYEKLSEMDPALRTEHPEAGEWSVGDILHHMVDSDLHFATRFIFNLTSDRPIITPFEESKYPSELHYDRRSFDISLAAHKSISATVRDLLAIAELDSWNRISIHPERGEKTLFELAQLGFGHLEGHLNHVEEVITKLS